VPKEDEGTIVSAVKLEIFWVTFKDRTGAVRNRMVFKNPKDRMLLWDMGVDKDIAPTAVGEPRFEDAEHLKVERLENMTITRAPEWLEDQIRGTLSDTDHFHDEKAQRKGSTADEIRERAEKIAVMDHPSGALGGSRS
jgi:hypothetical protein